METLFKHLKQKRVCVIGDLYIDECIDCFADGMAFEGPYINLMIEQKHLVPSAAGYLAMLLSTWGAKVSLIGMTGKDGSAQTLTALLQNSGINTDPILQSENMLTKSRTRIRVKGEHYPRQEITKLYTPAASPLTKAEKKTLINQIEQQAQQTDAFVIVDRDEHVICDDILNIIDRLAKKNDLLRIGDSEKKSSTLHGYDALVVNEEQLFKSISNERTMEEAAAQLRKKTGCKTLYLTLGAGGMIYIDKSEKQRVVTESRDVFDVTGAGESVAAAITVGGLQSLTPLQTARLANLIAGIVVSRAGLATVSSQEILDQIHAREGRQWAAKVIGLETLKKMVNRAKAENKKVVWTNGCYDLVHAGHILYLEKAKSLGDVLVVGLNSDRSVRLSKGPNRPIVTESQRAKLMSALSCVDYVIVFDDPSPLKIIEQIKPHVYAKGGDYDINSINQNERKSVEGYGGEIALLPGVKGMSTTNLIEKILKTYRDEK